MDVKILKGGKAPEVYGKYKFSDAEITDTRLMGVLGLAMHWTLAIDGRRKPEHLHFLLYFDEEELGLDRIKIITNNDVVMNSIAQRAAFGGLGAKMMDINENQTRYLVKYFIAKSAGMKIPALKETENLRFINDLPVVISPEELDDINRKICTALKTPYSVMNYYIMRCVGKDLSAAKLLVHPMAEPGEVQDLSLPAIGTFLINDIDPFTDENGKTTYLNRSLIETDNAHYMMLSELDVTDQKITMAKRLDLREISMEEASLLLNKTEYVSLYDIKIAPDMFDAFFGAYTLGCTKTEHDAGIMFMEFNPNNDHVEKPNYRLSDDVKAVYFKTDAGQLVVGTYSPEAMAETEWRLTHQLSKGSLGLTDRYQFAQSIVYEFALSGEPDFTEFLDSLE